MCEEYDSYDDYNDADKSAGLDTSDVQGNNIDSKFWSEATKAVLTCGISLIRKTFANGTPHPKSYSKKK